MCLSSFQTLRCCCWVLETLFSLPAAAAAAALGIGRPICFAEHDTGSRPPKQHNLLAAATAYDNIYQAALSHAGSNVHTSEHVSDACRSF